MECELQKYAVDFTNEVLSGERPLVVGRTREYEQMITTLTKLSSNNVLLIGDPGVGKNTLVENFAYDSHIGVLPPRISGKKVFYILVDRLLAGVENSGKMEERLGMLLSEIHHAGNVALYIPKIENILGGGGYGFDMSGVLLDYFRNGRMPVISTTTPASYKAFLEKKEDVTRLFDRISVEEPDPHTALFMLLGRMDEIEKINSVHIFYKAIDAVIDLSSSYMPEQSLPGRAVVLLEDTVASVLLQNKKTVEESDVEKQVEKKTKIVITDPTPHEKEVLLNLENELHQRIIDQEDAIGAIASAMRRLRSGFVNKNRPISTFLFLGPTGVGKTETAKALAELYFGNDDAMIRLDMSEFQTEDGFEKILGGGNSSSITLVDRIRKNPFSLLLLDEFEKAHPNLLNLFLQVFDEGRLTDSTGHTVSFVHTIIIATSNAGSELIREKIAGNASHDEVQKDLREYLLKSGVFRPELLNRFDAAIVFKPLTPDQALLVAKLQLIASLKKIEDQEIFITFDESVAQKIVQEGYDNESGARSMRRYVEGTIEDFLSKMILQGKLKSGARVLLTTDGDGNFTIQ